MKKYSKVLSLLLALCMVLGMMPVSALAASEDVDYLMFATDRHANTSIIGSIINNIESVIGENELEYLGLGGDMVGSGNNHPAYNSSTVLAEATGATSSLRATNVDIVAGIHDMNVTDDAGIVLPYKGGGAQIYEGDKYYVYGVEEYCISEDSNESNWSSEAKEFVTWANDDGIDTSKVIIVLSHYPLHAKRDDNDGAYYWHQALNTVATGSASGDSTVERNIVFFHGHNHTVDGNEYVYNVGDTMSIQNGSSTTSDIIYYTYATAGYLNQNSKATLMAIADDTVTLTKYTTSGSATMATVTRVVQETQPTGKTVSCDATYNSAANGDIVSATGLGLTGITATWSNSAEAAAADTFGNDDYKAYDIALTGYTENDTVTVTMELLYMETTGLVLYSVADDGTLTKIEPTNVAAGENSAIVTFTMAADSIAVVCGVPGVSIPDGATLDSLTLSGPTKKQYFLSEDTANDGNVYLDITGLEVTANYTYNNEPYTKPLEWNYFDETVDGYALNFGEDLETPGEKTVTVSYDGVEATFNVWVCAESVSDTDTDVDIAFDTECVVSVEISVADSAEEEIDGVITNAVSGLLDEGFLVYDITPAYAAGLESLEGTATVTLPIPEGVTNPVVYYVSDDGATVTNMNATANDDDTVTFTTTHFSTYVVGESTEITVPEPTTATVTGATTTITEEKEVYVLVSSISEEDDYLIASSDSSTTNLLTASKNNGVTNTSGVTVVTGMDVGGNTVTYIEDPAAAAIWTASSNSSGYRLYNSSLRRYLRYNNGLTTTSKNDDVTTWYPGENTLYRQKDNKRYVYYYNNQWTTDQSRQTVYFYQKQTVTFEVTTTVSGTYSIAGEDIEKVVVEGTTATLSSTLTFTPESGTATTTDTSGKAIYTVVEGGDPNGIISGISGNTVTFSGTYGKALVKVSYSDDDFGVVTNYITVTAKAPTYNIEITQGGTAVADNDVISVKGADTETPKTVTLGFELSYVDADGSETVETTDVKWEISGETANVTLTDNNDGTATVTATGSGEVAVTVVYTDANGKEIKDTVTINATRTTATTPEDGTDDFPEYPNEGAVRFDKTATAVGNFSETGIAKVELSMTGVPYTTGNEMDVVVMLDMTGSMSDNGMTAAEEATVAFVEKIVKNEDGSYNENRVAVYAFNSGSSSPYELVSLKSISSDTELAAANTAIRTASTKQTSGGTPFDEAAQKCYDVLQAAKEDGTGNDRQQFCVFMSDGGPTSYEGSDGYTYYGGNNTSGDRAITSYIGGYTSSDSSKWSFTLPTEYYTDLMKADGVTVYTVGLLLQNAPSNPAPYSSMTGSTYDSTTDSLTTIGSHYYFTSSILKQMATDESKYIDIFNVDNADDATAKFTAIAQSILEAAKNVVVEDKIADDYTMIFDIPTGVDSADLPDGSAQEFYIEVVEYTLDSNHERTTETILRRIYIDSNGAYYYDGTTKTYYTAYNAETNPGGVTVSGSGDTLTIQCQYFTYDAATRKLEWTAVKLTTTELALRYFLYLDGSAGSVGESGEIDAGTYPTNDYAYITYTNFQGNECKQKFPVPQMTWNGAQVSYVFYLVNEEGQPINKSGQVVDFANASFITDVYTESVVWNEITEEGTKQLSVVWLADKLLSDDYTIYDSATKYEIHVYETENGTDIYNNFTITAGGGTTKVYNTKAGTKYSAPNTYTADDVFVGFDFANTTVAFAVLWKPALTEDKVIVDYGLPVVINVVENDLLQNKITGIGLGTDAYGSTEINTGVSDTSELGTATLSVSDSNGVIGTISIENDTSIRFTLTNENFYEPVTFYYESYASFTEDGTDKTGYMYSSVTVYPASNVTYEESFGSDTAVYPGYEDKANTLEWVREGTPETPTQETQITPIAAGKTYNVFGYDEAYETDAGFSNGSAYKATVTMTGTGSDAYALTEKGYEFTFTGTGFDVLSECDKNTGMMVVMLYQGETLKKFYLVDTYFSGDKVTKNDDGTQTCTEGVIANGNMVYQVPVVRNLDLTYGTYTVKVFGYLYNKAGKVADAVTYSVRDTAVEYSPEEVALAVFEAYDYDPADVEVIFMDENSVLNGGTGVEGVETELTEEMAAASVGTFAVTDTSGEGDSAATETSGEGDSAATIYTAYVYLDGFRVYQPASDAETLAAYPTNEQGLSYNSIYKWADEHTDGSSIYYVERNGEGTYTTAAEYREHGPQNEIYLVGGDHEEGDTTATAAMIIGFADTDSDNTNNVVMISADSVQGTSVLGVLDSAGKFVAIDVLTTGTERFYDLSKYVVNNTLTIANLGVASNADGDEDTEDAVMSLNVVKTNLTVAESGTNDNVQPTAEVAMLALRAYSFEEPVIPEEPEEDAESDTGTDTGDDTDTDADEDEDDNDNKRPNRRPHRPGDLIIDNDDLFVPAFFEVSTEITGRGNARYTVLSITTSVDVDYIEIQDAEGRVVQRLNAINTTNKRNSELSRKLFVGNIRAGLEDTTYYLVAFDSDRNRSEAVPVLVAARTSGVKGWK